ncbi:MAG TPA: glycosyltransferase family 39 protein [Patescibacteria group bacterium]|nr:glycosyltransferase family 39 protein [Patescibacteria group bacterium]
MILLKSEKIASFVLSLFILLQLGQIIFSQRSLLFSKYDGLYWKDRVEHSQWVLPLSQRTVGDDGLFAYVGYTLVHGADPSQFNPETGPLGKYLLGFSILLFGNPYYATLFLGIGSIILLFLIGKTVSGKSMVGLFATFLLASDPLFASQLVSSSLDIMQVFFLLLSIWTFLKSLSASQYFSLLSGISLGLFSTIKFPILSPILFFLFAFAYYKKHKLFPFLLLCLGCITGFLFPYGRYFALGYSIKDFLKLQKYIIAFYAKSHLPVHHKALFDIFFLGKFPDISNGVLTVIQEWWIIWPISIIVSIFGMINIWITHHSLVKKMLTLYVIAAIFLFLFIPVYTRYILLVLPFLYFFTAQYITKGIEKWRVMVISSLYIVGIGFFVYLHSFLTPSVQPVLSYFLYNMSHGYFQDVYMEDIDNNQHLPNRSVFRLIAQKAYEEGQIQSVSFHQTGETQAHDSLIVSGVMTYATRNLGSFQEKKTIRFQKTDNVWKVIWDWNDLLNSFQPGDILIARVTFGKRGSVTDKTGNILVQDIDGYEVLIDPQKYSRQKEIHMLLYLSNLSGIEKEHIQNAYLENPYPGQVIPLFTSFYLWNEATKSAILSFQGLSVIPYPSRVYTQSIPVDVMNTNECCTAIYSSTTYQGVNGFEKQYQSRLHGSDGGSLILIDKKGNTARTILKKQAHDGENITLPL